jgi:hypothetical protein
VTKDQGSGGAEPDKRVDARIQPTDPGSKEWMPEDVVGESFEFNTGGPQVRIVGKLAERARALSSMREDVAFIDACLTFLESEEVQLRRVPEFIAAACWNAALVAYARCFGRGLRFAHRIEIPLERTRIHAWMKQHRDDYIAHLERGTAAEQLGAVVTLEPPPANAIRNVGVAGTRLILPEAGPLADIHDHIRWLASEVRALYDEVGESISGRVEAIPVATLYRHAARGTALRLD